MTGRYVVGAWHSWRDPARRERLAMALLTEIAHPRSTPPPRALGAAARETPLALPARPTIRSPALRHTRAGVAQHQPSYDFAVRPACRLASAAAATADRWRASSAGPISVRRANSQVRPATRRIASRVPCAQYARLDHEPRCARDAPTTRAGSGRTRRRALHRPRFPTVAVAAMPETSDRRRTTRAPGEIRRTAPARPRGIKLRPATSAAPRLWPTALVCFASRMRTRVLAILG